MIENIIKNLNENLHIVEKNISDNNKIIIKLEHIRNFAICPYCNNKSKKIHSRYGRNILDIPLQDYLIELKLNQKIFFCNNKDCDHTTFSERYDFLKKYARRTERLEDKISNISVNMSARCAKFVLKKEYVQISDDTILRILKKNKQD